METRHAVGRPFASEFSAFVMVVELRWPDVARPENFVKNFCVFWKNDPSQTVAILRGSRPKSATASPHIWLRLFLTSYISVHRTEKDSAGFVDSKENKIAWVLNKTGVKRGQLYTVEARKLAYYGHTMRKQRSCLEKEIMPGKHVRCTQARTTTGGLDG